MYLRALVCFLCLSLFGCGHTTVVVSGSYGPFTIGDNQQATLVKAEKIISIWSIEPLTSNEVYLENPNSRSIHAVDADNGILVWLDHHPWPLRIELKNDVVVNKWGMSDECQASQLRMRQDCLEVNRLAHNVNIGASRAEAYKVILTFKTKLSKQMGNFVVGAQQFRTGENKSAQAYRKLLLANEVWQFEGLKNLSKYKNPFYSRVTLYFHGGHLTKIKHWSSRYEMP